MNKFIKALNELDESSYKNEETAAPNVSKLDKMAGSNERSFKDLISTCGQIKEEEIEEYIRNVNNRRENSKSKKTLDKLHDGLQTQSIDADDEEDFV